MYDKNLGGENFSSEKNVFVDVSGSKPYGNNIELEYFLLLYFYASFLILSDFCVLKID
jgi:hypothetical protein